MSGAGNIPADFACSVDADLFARVAIGRSHEETRYYLHGVRVEPAKGGGVLLIATDGHVLLAARDPAGWCRGSAIVRPNATLLRAIASKSDKHLVGRRVIATASRVGVCDVGGQHVPGADDVEMLLGCGLNVIAFQWRDVCIDGAFPDWRKVVPVAAVNTLTTSVACRPEYVSRLGAALKRSKHGGLSFSVKDDKSPIVVVGDMPEMFALLMPLRESRSPAVPEWVAPLPTPPSAPAPTPPARRARAKPAKAAKRAAKTPAKKRRA